MGRRTNDFGVYFGFIALVASTFLPRQSKRI